MVLFQPLYDAYLPLVLPRRRRAALRPADAARLADHRGGARRGLHRRAPGWSCSTIRTIRPRGCSTRRSWRCSPRPASRHDALALSDEVWEHVVFDGRRHLPLAVAARHGRADGQDRLGRQDLLADRLEGRLGGRAARRSPRRSPRRTSSSPSPTPPNLQSAVAYGLGKADGLFRARCAPTSPPRATGCARGLEAAGYRRAAGRRHLFPVDRPRRLRHRARRRRLLRARGRAKRASPRSRSRPSTPRIRSTSVDPPLLRQAGRDARRRRSSGSARRGRCSPRPAAPRIAPAIQAQTISCSVWKIITGRMTSPAAAPGKRMRAIGAPLARLLTEPQNRMAARLGAREAAEPADAQAAASTRPSRSEQQRRQHGEVAPAAAGARRRRPSPPRRRRRRRAGSCPCRRWWSARGRSPTSGSSQRPQGVAEHEGQEQQGEDLADAAERDRRRPAPASIKATSSGVRKTPSRFEKAAAATAPATLPRAIEV